MSSIFEQRKENTKNNEYTNIYCVNDTFVDNLRLDVYVCFISDTPSLSLTENDLT